MFSFYFFLLVNVAFDNHIKREERREEESRECKLVYLFCETLKCEIGGPQNSQDKALNKVTENSQ